MCLILFSFQPGSATPLVVAANRDEFFARPSRHAQIWRDPDSGVDILSGIDEQAGGTWLGVAGRRRFAAVTNIRDPSMEADKPRSRGELTRQFLAGPMSAADYAEQLKLSFGEYAGYNLLLWDGEQMWYLNNFERLCIPLEPGLYGLSNGLLDSPWPKIMTGKAALATVLSADQEASTDALLAIMDMREPAVDEELPSTGVSLDLERLLSPAFILNSDRGYGTRCSSALIIEPHMLRFSEQNYDLQGQATTRHYFEF